MKARILYPTCYEKSGTNYLGTDGPMFPVGSICEVEREEDVDGDIALWTPGGEDWYYVDAEDVKLL